MLWALTAISVSSGLIYLWRGYRIVTERIVVAALLAVTVGLWFLGFFMHRLAPSALGIEIGSVAGVFWVWSDRAQMPVLVIGAILAGIMAHLNQFMLLAMVPLGVGILVLGRSLWMRFPEFDARGTRGKIRPYRHHVLLCYGDRCQLRGADLLLEAMGHSPTWKIGNGVRVTTSECLGYCQQGPVLWVEPEATLSTAVRLRDLPQFFDKGDVKCP